jgi:hypothetical protein
MPTTTPVLGLEKINTVADGNLTVNIDEFFNDNFDKIDDAIGDIQSDSTITKQGNTFNGASQLVKKTSDNKYPVGDGSLLTNLPIPADAFSTDQKTAGTNGGTFTAGAWRTRDLNTVLTNEISGASLAANAITLPAGTYYCDASANVLSVNNHKMRLRKTNNTAETLLVGTSEFNYYDASASNSSKISGRFILTEISMVELQHFCQTTAVTTGFGTAVNLDNTAEIYADIKIWKVA